MKTKTTRKVINNLREKLEDRKFQFQDLYNQYIYKSAIKQTIREKLGYDLETSFLTDKFTSVLDTRD